MTGVVVLLFFSKMIYQSKTDVISKFPTPQLPKFRSLEFFFFIVSYRKPSQTPAEFTQYCDQFNEILEKINHENLFMSIHTVDFNAKHNSWYSEHSTDKFGTEIHDLFAKHGIIQTVNQPTNITSRTNHCIDLVATDQPNIIIKLKLPHPFTLTALTK